MHDPGGAPPDQLNFSYSVSGSAPWKPKRVYSDGSQTYIQFPEIDLRPGCAGAVRGQRRPEPHRQLPHEERHDDRRLRIDKAILVSGVGWRQQKITIRRGG
jgi:type IV secretory pathway VirB9-like protein